MESSPIDLLPAQKLARGKNQKVWLDALLSDTGLIPSEHITVTVGRSGVRTHPSNIASFIHRLRLLGYDISEVPEVHGWEMTLHLVGMSPESVAPYRLLCSLLLETRHYGVALVEMAQPQRVQHVREIAAMGSVAVELAQCLWDGGWDGSVEELATTVRSLAPSCAGTTLSSSWATGRITFELPLE